MKTIIYKLDGTDNDIKYIKECAEIIRSGGTAAFPTETVYGLGANALDEEACRKIYCAKNRQPDKALLCHLYSVEQAERIAYLTDIERRLIMTFTPGPLTVIARKRDCIGKTVSAGGTTVGLRFPSNRVALLLMREAGIPIAAASANISDLPAPTDAEEVIGYLDGRIDAILDCGKTGSGIASTIISAENGLRIIREGSITEEEILRAMKA
ncbi:MAG: L-threonylcarbamoyladenylate synthase [Eubacteriales bacterium]|nr:L-threonylcarbamoyladenylate synthase [Eubacteriales bacterium]